MGKEVNIRIKKGGKVSHNGDEFDSFLDMLENDETLSDSTIALLKSHLDNLPDDEISSSGPASLITNQSYKPVDVDDFPMGTYIHKKTGKIANQYMRFSDEYLIKQEDVFSLLEEFGFKEIFNKGMFMMSAHYENKVYELETNDGIVLVGVDSIIKKWLGKVTKSYKADRGVVLLFCGNIDTDYFNNIIERFSKLLKKRKEKENNISLVIQTQRGYDTTTFELPQQKLDIELGYGKSFKPIHEKIIHKLNEPKSKGLVLLHGTPGTGKTHYLKYLASKIKNKRVLFIPPFLADFITSPEMTPFLIQNSNSILFIEDAERVITDRNNGGGNGVSNILNITDGILSDILNIQIVATFNMDKAKIDEALLRKGRLIAEHKFEALPIEDSQALVNHLGYEYTVTKPMTLTEIYNLGETEYKSEDKGRPTIGFNRY